MSSPAAAKTSGTLSESQKTALISLLGDEDPVVYQAVRDKILSCGQTVTEIGCVRTLLSSDPALRRRAQEIIQHLARHVADDKFLSFCLTEGTHFNLEQGAWLLAQTQYPDINLEAYQALFDSYAAELRERIDVRADADQILASFNEYIFETLQASRATNKTITIPRTVTSIAWLIAAPAIRSISASSISCSRIGLKLPVSGIRFARPFSRLPVSNPPPRNIISTSSIAAKNLDQGQLHPILALAQLQCPRRISCTRHVAPDAAAHLRQPPPDLSAS